MMKTLSIIGAMVCLVACNSAPQRSTMDAIQAQLKESVNRQNTAVTDEAVNAALLPPVASLAEQLPKARAALEDRFNVNFNNVPVSQFYHSLVLGTRYNMLVHPDVTGTITANLKDVTLTEALDAVREMYGYDYKIEGSKIYIRPLTMQTRMFRVNYLVGARRGTSNLRVTSTSVSNPSNGNNNGNNNNNNQNLNNGNNNGNNGNNNNGINGGNQNDSSTVQTSVQNDFWVELKASIETIIGKEQGRSVVVSPQSGVIVIRAMPNELRQVEQFLKATQLSVERQVILEAKILEVELTESTQTGINWATFSSFKSKTTNRVSGGFVGPGTTLAPLPFDGSQPPAMTANSGLSASTGFSLSNPAAAVGSLVGFAVQTSNFAALLSFLESQGKVHTLSNPRVAAVNNQPSLLKIGTDEYYVTGVTTTSTSNTNGTNNVTPSVTVSPFFSGVVLDVTPQIDDSGNILLHVHPSVTQVATVIKGINLGSAGNLSLPLAASSTSEMDTIVRGKDGNVVVIGGLMRQAATDDQSEVPGAGDVPVLGALFKNKSRTLQKRELVVLIKPTIVDSGSNWNDDLMATGRRMQDLDPRGKGNGEH